MKGSFRSGYTFAEAYSGHSTAFLAMAGVRFIADLCNAVRQRRLWPTTRLSDRDSHRRFFGPKRSHEVGPRNAAGQLTGYRVGWL